MTSQDDTNKQNLAPELLNALCTTAEHFDQVWDGMLNDGFTVDEYYFRILAKLEPSEPGLIPAKKYLIENIKESFTNTYWLMRNRSSSMNGYRSSYLDWLEEQNKLGKWVIDNQGFNIQPSFMALRQVKYDGQDPTLELKRSIKQSIKLQITQDISQLKAKVPDFFKVPFVLAKKDFTKLLGSLLSDIGFTLVKIEKDLSAIVFSKPLPKSLGFISLCFDNKQWTQQHRWDITVAISQQPVTRWFTWRGYPSMPIAFDLGLFSPGWRVAGYFLDFESRQDFQGVWHPIRNEIDDDRNKYAALFMTSAIRNLDNLISESIQIKGAV